MEWLCLSVSLARDRFFMETLQWPLDGEWIGRWEKGRWGGGVIGCERENTVQCVLQPHMCKYGHSSHTYTMIPVALSILQGGLGVKERAKGYPCFLGGGW